MTDALLPPPDPGTIPADVVHIISVARNLGDAQMRSLEAARAQLLGGRDRIATLAAIRKSVQVAYAAAEVSQDLAGQVQTYPSKKTFWWYVRQLSDIGYGISHVAVAAAVRQDIPSGDYARLVAPWLAAGLTLSVGGTLLVIDEVTALSARTSFPALIATVEASVAVASSVPAV